MIKIGIKNKLGEMPSLFFCESLSTLQQMINLVPLI